MKDTIVKILYSSKVRQKCLAKTECQIFGLPFEFVSFKIMPTDISTNKKKIFINSFFNYFKHQFFSSFLLLQFSIALLL